MAGLRCMSCNGKGVILTSRKGFPLNSGISIANSRVCGAKPCTMCKKGRIVKKFDMLKDIKNLHIDFHATQIKRTIYKVVANIQQMEMENDRL